MKFKSNQELYNYISNLIQELTALDERDWAERFQSAMTIGSTSGEVLGEIRLTLQAFIKTDLPVYMGIVKEIRSVNRSLNRILGPSSLNNLPKDIEIYVDKHFPADQWQEVLSLLRHAVLHDGTTPAARTLRCALFASNSDLEKLDYYLNEIAIDYRDVIVAGEYELQDGELIQVRDLSKSFSTENKS